MYTCVQKTSASFFSSLAHTHAREGSRNKNNTGKRWHPWTGDFNPTLHRWWSRACNISCANACTNVIPPKPRTTTRCTTWFSSHLFSPFSASFSGIATKVDHRLKSGSADKWRNKSGSWNPSANTTKRGSANDKNSSPDCRRGTTSSMSFADPTVSLSCANEREKKHERKKKVSRYSIPRKSNLFNTST